MNAAHRHTASGHEHEFEPQHGLPEPLPPGERLLWQGSPDWRALAVRAFHLRKLALYFAALVLLRGAFALDDGAGPAAALASMLWPLGLAALALSLVAMIAWMSARTTVYTLTDRRVVMRIGIVLTLTFNIPLKRIATAGLHLHAGGSGDLPLALLGSDRIAFLQLWPHARPWRARRPEPMLRCVPQAAAVARLLSDAWSAATGVDSAPQPRVAASSRPAPNAQPSNAQQPALAGR